MRLPGIIERHHGAVLIGLALLAAYLWYSRVPKPAQVIATIDVTGAGMTVNGS